MGRKKYILLTGVVLLAGCGGGGGDTSTSTGGNTNNPTYGDNYITSTYGTAKLEFPNGLVVVNQPTSGLSAQGSLGNVIVYLPHTGGQANLTVNNDSTATYIYITSNGINIYNNADFSLGSTNLSWEQVSCSATYGNTYSNEFMVKLTHSSPQETGTFNLNLQEGESINFDNFRLYDLIQQNSSNVCDLGDYFDSFTVKANVMPQVNPVSTSSCPSIDLGNGNYSVPYNATCVEFNIKDNDGVGSNHQYSLDGTNWVPVTLPASVQVDVSSLPAGSSTPINLYVGETVSNGNKSFDGVRLYSFNILKDVQAGLNIYCNDGKTGNVWQVNNGETCVFTDPTQGSNAPYTHSINFTFNDGTSSNCRLEVYKNGSLVDQGTYPCNGVNHSYVLDNADTGNGQQQVDVKLYKDYGGNNVLIDAKTFYSRINKAPTLSLNTPSSWPKEGRNFQFDLASCSDNEGDAVSLSVSNLPYGFSYTDNGNGILSVSANPVPFELPDGTSLVHHGDPDGDGRWDTLTQQIYVSCSDGVDTVTQSMNFVVLDTNRALYVTQYPAGGTYSIGYTIQDQIQCSDPDKEDVMWYNILWIYADACTDNNSSTLCVIDHSTGRYAIDILSGDVSRGYVEVEARCRDLPGGLLAGVIVIYIIR